MKISRRMVLRGIGGAIVSLPFLESLGPKRARGDMHTPPFAIFLRQANGCAAEQNTEVGAEPERFWPRMTGTLTPENVSGRALDELEPYLSKLLVVHNVNMNDFNYGDGHARGALQGLTARGPTVEGAGGSSEAAGESLDHRIGRELNPDGRDSLFLYAGRDGGWLGGPCISYRGPAQRRGAIHNPWNAYQSIVGGETGLSPEAQMQITQRQRSVNDLVRDQLTRLMSRPQISAADRDRLQLHFDSIRELETTLTCQMAADAEAALEGMSAGYDSTDGDLVMNAARLHFDVAALAVACGYTRSVALQIGSGNDGSTRYRNLDTGAEMENYHYVSHRRASHDSSGSVISNSDLLHHMVDRQFAQTFRHLLDRLSAYDMPDGQRLLDHGVAVWYNDNGNGPGHSSRNVPFVLAGSCNGFLRQGMYVEAVGDRTHKQMLNTIGSAVGLRNASGEHLDDFGDPSLPGGVLSELLA